MLWRWMAYGAGALGFGFQLTELALPCVVAAAFGVFVLLLSIEIARSLRCESSPLVRIVRRRKR